MNNDRYALVRRGLLLFGLVSLVGVLFVSIGVGSVAADAPDCSTVSYAGDGTESNPYEVGNVDQLQCINSQGLGANYVQTSDIDASETESWNSGKGFKSVGNDATEFSGTFDGSVYTITGLYINRSRSNEDGTGLFGSTHPEALIEGVGLKDVNVKNPSKVTGFGGFVGGIVGENDGTVSESYAMGAVSGDDSVGGLVGFNGGGTVNKSYAAVEVSGDADVGGLVGSNTYDGTVESSYATGDVPSECCNGGLVADNRYYSPVINSYWDVDTTGQTTSDGGTGLTTEEMTGSAAESNMDFDFTNTWDVETGEDESYPFLQNNAQTPPPRPDDDGGDGSDGSGPEILEETFGIEPFPVEKGDKPTVSLTVEDASNVEISLNGETEEMKQLGDSNAWQKEIPPSEFSSADGEVGERVNVEIIADGGEDTLSNVKEAYPRTQLPADPGTVPPTEQIHYYVFDYVKDVPVVLAKFENQNVSDFGFGDAENVTQWEQAREYDVNSYMGSGRGASGSIGFNLKYHNNSTDFYTVDERDVYTSPISAVEALEFRCTFALDAKNAASLQGEDIIATHPGRGPSNDDVTAYAVGGACGPHIYQDMGSENTDSIAHYGVWLEELSHLYLGMGDLYSESKGGDVKGGLGSETGLMAGEANGEPGTLPQPYSVLSRTSLNDLGFADSDDPHWPWAVPDRRDISTDPSGTTVGVKRVTDIGVGDPVPILSTNKTGAGPLNGTVKYLFEGYRSPTSSGGTLSFVRGYKITQQKFTSDLESAILVNTNINGVKSLIRGGLFAEFSVSPAIPPERTGEPLDVTVSYTSKKDSKSVSLTQSLSTGFGSVVSDAPNVTLPDLDLRAVDSEGRVTGVNEDGEYVNEIPGAEASGDTNGVEWITVPDDADVEFEVLSDDVEEFIEETDATEENVSVNYSTSVTSYGSDTEVVTENGEPTVTNTTTKVVTENESIDPGTTEDAVDETVIAGFSQTPNQPSPGDSVKFNGSLSTDLNGEIASYEWDFGGDGTTDATGQTASRSYSSTGDYTVELTVTGDDGTTDTTIQTISVVDVGSLSPDNPFGDENNEPLGELKVVQRLVSWNEDGQIDGESYGELELIQHLVEWNEAK